MQKPTTKELKFALVMSLVTTFFVTIVLASINIGFTDRFLYIWLRSWGVAFIIALLSILYIGPFIKNLMDKSTKIILAILITPIVISLFILLMIFTNPRLNDSPDYHSKEFAGYFVREFSFQSDLLYSSYKVKFKNEKDTTKERNVVHLGILGNIIKVSDKLRD